MSDIQDIRSRLQSTDFNTRIQAAAELGEVGSPNDAPILIEMTWNDEISNVKQFAIQAYAEIMKNEAYDEVLKVITEHPDKYVVHFAISILGQLNPELIINDIKKLIHHEDEKFRTIAIRSAITAGLKDLKEDVLEQLQKETYPLAIKNCLEALALWKYKKAREIIEDIIVAYGSDVEITTFAHFALASFGNKESKKIIEEGEIDEYSRLTVNGTRFSGREGLLLAMKEL